MTAILHSMPASRDEALNQFVRQHQRPVWRHLRLLGCSGLDAEEIAQDAFLIALRKEVAALDPDAALAWLKTTARHLWIDRNRASGRSRETAWGDAVDAFEAPSDAEHSQWITALRACVDALDGRSREALEMRYRDRLSREEMAIRLGLRPQGVKTLIRRLRDALRSCVERKQP